MLDHATIDHFQRLIAPFMSDIQHPRLDQSPTIAALHRTAPHCTPKLEPRQRSQKGRGTAQRCPCRHMVHVTYVTFWFPVVSGHAVPARTLQECTLAHQLHPLSLLHEGVRAPDLGALAQQQVAELEGQGVGTVVRVGLEGHTWGPRVMGDGATSRPVTRSGGQGWGVLSELTKHEAVGNMS